MRDIRFITAILCLGLLLSGCSSSDSDDGDGPAAELPDLEMDLVQKGGAGTVEQGQWFTVTREFSNTNGCDGSDESKLMAPAKADGDAGAFSVGYYFSTDQTLDDGDVLMSPVEEMTELAGCSGVDWSDYLLMIPADFPVGTYYCIAVVDVDDEVDEDDETNNRYIAAWPQDVIAPAGSKPDLYVNGSGYNGEVTQGGTAYAEFNLVNGGAVRSETACIGRLYYSDDQLVDAGDTLIGEDVALQEFYVGQKQTLVFNYTVPDTYSGACFMLFVVDIDDEVDEGASGENNNVDVSAITVNP